MKTSQIASLFDSFLVATKENNTKEFNKLYPRVNQVLVRTIKQKSSTLGQYDAEEISNDAIIKAINSVSTFDAEKSKFSTFVVNIAKNEMLNRFNANKQQKRDTAKNVTLDHSVNDDTNSLKTFEKFTGYVDSKIDNVEVKSTKDILFEKYYRHLSPNQIKIVKLTVKGYTQEEIGEMLNMPRNTVKVNMLRAKNKLEEVTGIEVKRQPHYKREKALV